MNTIQIIQEVDPKRVSDLLCNALEGGSNYWYYIDKFIEPHTWTIGEIAKGNKRHFANDYPVNQGGALMISERKDTGEATTLKQPVRLGQERIAKGLKIMARDYPQHFNDFMREQDDAETGDVFLQCCIFGEVIYG